MAVCPRTGTGMNVMVKSTTSIAKHFGIMNESYCQNSGWDNTR
jgi:hypothetical protein